MQQDTIFYLEDKITEWYTGLKSSPELTNEDAEELKLHLSDSISNLVESGLDEEEAFLIATKRMGYLADCEKDYSDANFSVKQLYKTLIVFTGVILYFLLDNLIGATSKLLIIVIRLFDFETLIAIVFYKYYIIIIHLIFVVFTASIYFMEDKVVSNLSKLKMTPRKTLYLLIATIIMSILNLSLLPLVKNSLKGANDFRGVFHDINRYYEFSFPFLIGCAFLILYLRYNKKAGF